MTRFATESLALLRESRPTAAMAVPSGLAFVYMLLDGSAPWIADRLTSALTAAAAVGFMSYLGFALMDHMAKTLLGDVDNSQLPPRRTALAGMLLFAAVWIWWQADRDSTVRRVAGCIESMDAIEFEEAGRQQAVLDCYRERLDEDYSSP